jgi:hypothetical protein
MKKFLLNISVFFLLNILFLAIIFGISFYIVLSASFAIPKEKNILIIGDSHPECAIDDNIFSRSFNASQSGTAYLYSYVKLKKFLEVNQHVDTVFISFHADVLVKAIDEWVVGDNTMRTHIPQKIFLFDKEELEIFRLKPSFYSAIIRMPLLHVGGILKFLLNRPLEFRDLHIGGYLRLDRDKLQQDIELRENNIATEFNNEENEYSEYQLIYLQKIVTLCREKGIEPVLLNTPTYMPEKYGNIPMLNDYYNTYFSDITYLDYSDFPLPDEGYGDIGHLNYKGAEIFSQWLESNY